MRERVSSTALADAQPVGAKTDGKRKADVVSPKTHTAKTLASKAHSPDPRGGFSKRLKSGEGGSSSGRQKGSEGGSSSGRQKRKANLSCVHPDCRLLDESPISTLAQHCGA